MGPVDSAADKARAPDEWAANDGALQSIDRKPLDRRDSTSPDALRERIDQLPPGHPSSPYDADGSPRQPIPRLRDLETHDEEDLANDGWQPPDEAKVNDRRQASDPVANLDAALHTDRQSPKIESSSTAEPSPEIAWPSGSEAERSAGRIRPFTDAEWKEHVTDVRTRLDKAHGEGLATDRRYTIDPDRSRWTRDRRQLQGEIADTLYEEAAKVPNDHKAIIAGGLAGAGKTTVLGDHAGIDRSQYLTINPDVIKVELAKRGLVPRVEGLSPMEASDLVHEESSYVARQLALRAQSDGKNIIWDITMSSRASTERRIDELREADYTTVKGIFVDIPVKVSGARTDARHRQEQDAYEAGFGLGGRYVPPEVISAQSDPEWGSRNQKTFEELKHRFDYWSKYDNSVYGRDPILVEASSREQDPERTTL
jgi:predicted kinase